MSRRLPETNPSARPNRYRFSKYKKTLVLLTMAAPTAIWLLLLRYLPMGGIILAFKEYKVNPRNPSFISNLINSKWVGLNNFNFLFMTDDAKIMFRNTLLYNIVFIILGIIIPVAFAIMLNEVTKKFVAKAYQTMMFFPYFLSWVVVSYFLNAFIDGQYGMITAMQRAAGGEMTNWYTTLGPWPYIIVFANLWKNVGYTTVLYLSAITGIDSTQYEAAAIDGASKWQQIWYVTIPNLRTMICILFIMNVGKIFNADFGLFYSVPMNSGALFPVTQVIDTYVYRALMVTGRIDMSSAAGLLQNVLGFICILTANNIVKKIDADSSMF
ncbi:MAG: ABC transporter permease subunit [Oscillospiraceae bacterium]|jgi:putative aldouronate transport system permease protein|nr:ABC transporter permease subunit [Oscillospiraceae bacterium]